MINQRNPVNAAGHHMPQKRCREFRRKIRRRVINDSCNGRRACLWFIIAGAKPRRRAACQTWVISAAQEVDKWDRFAIGGIDIAQRVESARTDSPAPDELARCASRQPSRDTCCRIASGCCCRLRREGRNIVVAVVRGRGQPSITAPERTGHAVRVALVAEPAQERLLHVGSRHAVRVVKRNKYTEYCSQSRRRDKD